MNQLCFRKTKTPSKTKNKTSKTSNTTTSNNKIQVCLFHVIFSATTTSMNNVTNDSAAAATIIAADMAALEKQQPWTQAFASLPSPVALYHNCALRKSLFDAWNSF